MRGSPMGAQHIPHASRGCWGKGTGGGPHPTPARAPMPTSSVRLFSNLALATSFTAVCSSIICSVGWDGREGCGVPSHLGGFQHECSHTAPAAELPALCPPLLPVEYRGWSPQPPTASDKQVWAASVTRGFPWPARHCLPYTHPTRALPPPPPSGPATQGWLCRRPPACCRRSAEVAPKPPPSPARGLGGTHARAPQCGQQGRVSTAGQGTGCAHPLQFTPEHTGSAPGPSEGRPPWLEQLARPPSSGSRGSGHLGGPLGTGKHQNSYAVVMIRGQREGGPPHHTDPCERARARYGQGRTQSSPSACFSTASAALTPLSRPCSASSSLSRALCAAQRALGWGLKPAVRDPHGRKTRCPLPRHTRTRTCTCTHAHAHAHAQAQTTTQKSSPGCLRGWLGKPAAASAGRQGCGPAGCIDCSPPCQLLPVPSTTRWSPARTAQLDGV
jgi:hypothetical protein